MTTDKRGVSALLLQRQLGLRRYETAWMMLHKLRRAMVNVAREPLRAQSAVFGFGVKSRSTIPGSAASSEGADSSRELHSSWSLWRSAGEPWGASAWPSFLTSRRPPSTTSSSRTLLPVLRSTPMALRPSRAFFVPDPPRSDESGCVHAWVSVRRQVSGNRRGPEQPPNPGQSERSAHWFPEALAVKE